MYKVCLPCFQVLLAVIALIAGPYQLHHAVKTQHVVSNLYWYGQNWPSPVERVSLSLNFPAGVLNRPFRYRCGIALEWPNRFANISLRRNDVSFLVFVGIFWFCIGTYFDRERATYTKLKARFRVAVKEYIAGVIMGVLCGVSAISMLLEDWEYMPQVEIASAGIAWSLLLIVYFSKKLMCARRPVSL